MKTNRKNYDLRIDTVGILTGDTRAQRYAEILRREIFDSAEEMNRYYCVKSGSDLERFINELTAR